MPATESNPMPRIVVDRITKEFRADAQLAVRILGYNSLSAFLIEKMQEAIADAKTRAPGAFQNIERKN